MTFIKKLSIYGSYSNKQRCIVAIKRPDNYEECNMYYPVSKMRKDVAGNTNIFLGIKKVSLV